MIGNLQNQPPIETADPVELSSRVIDTGELTESFNRVTQTLSEVDEGIAIVESFSHVIAFATDAGLLCFDSSGAHTGADVVSALRGWSADRVDTIVYTHGHLDHVGGSGAFAADAVDRGYDPPTVVAHQAVHDRFERYRLTNGWNNAINLRQFGGISPAENLGIGGTENLFLPEESLWPTVEYVHHHHLSVGGLEAELQHDRGETDDHTWAWIPEHRALCVGDFVTWVFPNCGNPQKVQRYPAEWAAALREMMTFDAQWLFGAHGLPVRGGERIRRVLGDLAGALEHLVTETLAMMNAGEPLDAILHSVSVPEAMTTPWMLPVYDEPEYVVRNIWRQYGGWWDQDPASLKPSPRSVLGAEIATLVGGVQPLIDRALELTDARDFRLACHLIEFAVTAEPESGAVHEARAHIYQVRRDNELSLMAKGIYSAAANESKDALGLA